MVAKCVNPKQKKRPGAYPYAGTLVGSIVRSFTSGQIMYLLREVILLVVYGTITDGDDYDEIAEGGEAHLDFLRGMSEFHYGIPREDWLRVIVNRVDPTLFRLVSKPGSIRALLALLLRPSGRGDLTEKWLARRDRRGRFPKSRFSALLQRHLCRQPGSSIATPSRAKLSRAGSGKSAHPEL
jgi:hypothetical protein